MTSWQVRTTLNVVLEANADFPLGVGGDSQPRFSLHVFLRKIYVLFWTRIHNFNVYSLVRARANIRGDDDE